MLERFHFQLLRAPTRGVMCEGLNKSNKVKIWIPRERWVKVSLERWIYVFVIPAFSDIMKTRGSGIISDCKPLKNLGLEALCFIH